MSLQSPLVTLTGGKRKNTTLFQISNYWLRNELFPKEISLLVNINVLGGKEKRNQILEKIA